MPLLSAIGSRNLTGIGLERIVATPPAVISLSEEIALSSFTATAVTGNSEPSAVNFSAASTAITLALAQAVAGNAFTIEMKLRITGPAGFLDCTPVGLYESATGKGIGFQYSGDIFTGIRYYNTATSQQSGSIITSSYKSVWITVAIVMSGTAWRFYQTSSEGAMSRRLTETLPTYARADFYDRLWIGRSTYPNAPPVFEGDLESIRISNIARYSDLSVTEPSRLVLDANTIDLITVR